MSTLIKPPAINPKTSLMENTLQLTALADVTPDMFTNTRPLWRPPGARGVYGGAVIAQCLSAAQRTVPPDFTVHSMHCYFVLAGNSEIPIIYNVERVREGRSFATRTVQARQRGKPIFTVTLSFMKELQGTERVVSHAVAMPEAPDPPPADDSEANRNSNGPFESQHLDSVDGGSSRPECKRTRMWIKTRGKISDEGGHEAHLSALAYMSDSYFIGTVARAHKLWRTFPPKGESSLDKDAAEDMKRQANKATQFVGMDDDLAKKIREMNGGAESNTEKRPEIGMMVSLDHTIFFHRPRDFRADDWLLAEMDTKWAGDGRGLVHQSIWTRDGKLVATCFQEGLVRLKQDHPSKL